MSKLLVNKARSPYSAKFWIVPTDIDVTSSTVFASLSGAQVIGSIERFSEANPRTTSPRYEINSDEPGEIVERIPSLVDRTLTIERAVLYTSDILTLLGSTDFNDVIDNYKAFAIMKQEISPAGSTAGTKITYFTGCWFHDFPKTYELTGNLKIVQNVPVGYTRRIIFNQ